MHLRRKSFARKLGSVTHPWFRADCFYPIRKRRDKAQIFAHMLLAHPSGRDGPSGRQHDRTAEDGLGHKDSFGMVAERPVTEVRDYFLRLVEPGMNGQIIFHRAAPFFHAGKRVVIRMCHVAPPSKSMVVSGGVRESQVRFELYPAGSHVEDELAIR